MEPIIKIKNLQVIYNLGKSNQYQALRDVNLEIFPGEYVTFFGPSGCGKSTLLYTIAGLEFPTDGEVIVEGKNPVQLKHDQLVNFHQKTIGMVFQAYYLISHLNIVDNVLLPRIFAGDSDETRDKVAKELMERFGLTELSKRRPAQLSGGQQQRVAIARALVNNPTIILADEPVGNLDSKNSEIVLKLLDDVHQSEKKTIIHVSHNPMDLKYSDRIFYMKDGQIEKVVENKKVKRGDENVTDADILSQTYPYLNKNEILSKLILNQVISDFSIETQRDMEKVISQFIGGKISKQKLVEMFDKPTEEGGFSLNKTTAKAMGKSIGKLIEGIEIASQDVEKDEDKSIKRARSIRQYLCDSYNLKLSYQELKRLDELLNERFGFKLSRPRFEQKVDKPFNEGGLGIDKRITRKICREVELIMIGKKFK